MIDGWQESAVYKAKLTRPLEPMRPGEMRKTSQLPAVLAQGIASYITGENHHQRNVAFSRKSRKSTRKSRKSTRKSRKSTRKSRKSSRKPRKSTKKSRKSRKSARKSARKSR